LKKRYTIRWIKQGEENTKFFHAMATERYRRNAIASLVSVIMRRWLVLYGIAINLVWDLPKVLT
jgi:lipoate-protein ligase B